MTTCEQARHEGVQSAERDIAPGGNPPEASVEQLGQLFNTLGRFSPEASVEELPELFNKQEISDQAKSVASPAEQRRGNRPAGYWLGCRSGHRWFPDAAMAKEQFSMALSSSAARATPAQTGWPAALLRARANRALTGPHRGGCPTRG